MREFRHWAKTDKRRKYAQMKPPSCKLHDEYIPYMSLLLREITDATLKYRDINISRNALQ